MTKPNPAAIRAAVPLSARNHPRDAIAFCTVCARAVDPADLPSAVWREHDEADRPIPGREALIFLGAGRDHAKCRRELDAHPRLYAEEEGRPGYFPELCGPCKHRDGLACRHPDLKANGGEGLGVTMGGPRVHISCRPRSQSHWTVRRPVKCAGRTTLALVRSP